MSDHIAALEGVLGYENLIQEGREAILAAIALMRGQSDLLLLLDRIQTHLAVGCAPQIGYKSAHSNLTGDIYNAMQLMRLPPEQERDDA